jgi:thioredoxin reductase
VTALDLSGGTNESPALSRFCIQPPSMERRCLEPYAKPITEAVRIPTILAGRILTPEDAEAVLASGAAQYVSLGRALTADAYFPAKAFGRMPTPIRACISCNVCFERLTLERDVACVTNPMLGTEFEEPALAEPQLGVAEGFPRPAPQRVLVLGAGVAGMEVARIAAARGHVVEVWEKAVRPGGQMHLAVAAPDKQEVWPVWTYRWDQAMALGVTVRTDVAVTEAAIRGFAPDHIVVATGARPRPLAVPGDPAPLQAWDVIANPALVPHGAKVVVVGGGIVALEVADVLAVHRGCASTVLEAGPAIAPAMARNNRTDLIIRLREAGCAFHVTAAVLRREGATLHATVEGAPRALPCDVLVAAVGAVPNRDALPAVEATGLPFTLVGDCNQPGDFLTGLRDAWMTGLAIGMPARGEKHA